MKLKLLTRLGIKSSSKKKLTNWNHFEAKSESESKSKSMSGEEASKDGGAGGTSMDVSPSSAVVDEKLYSRQLYVMGHEAQRRMMSSRVLLVGVSGLGAEVAKNCILAGVSSLVLCDPHEPDSFDLGGNFYLSETHLGKGKSRADLCRDRLAELNQYVSVSVAPTTVTAAALKFGSASDNDVAAFLNLVSGMSCVVVTIPLSDTLLSALNAKCREHNCAFIYSRVAGVFGQVFCDFGEAFVVSDADGEQPATSQVESIIPDTPIVVKCLEDQGRHGLETGDVVTFARISSKSSMSALNGQHLQVKVTGPYTFELTENDVTKQARGQASDSASADAITQGYITQIKQPKTVPFQTYADKLAQPGDMMLSDFAKFDRPPLLHLAFRALTEFQSNHDGQLPKPGWGDEATEFFQLCKSLDSADVLKDVAADHELAGLLKNFSSGSRAVLSPMCAMLGGIVGQEVLKAVSGKFMPIQGFFYFDAAECLPLEELPADLLQTSQSRYDSQIIVFGKDMQEKLLNLKYFLVGAGAIGCEMLKNWALIGVGCGPQGQIHITDMDTIEKSNLSRQFLFRNTDIGEFKSATAAKAAQAMNKDMKIEPMQEKVGPTTEHIFGDAFFDALSGVCTALDNVEARLYVDSKCLFYRKPMLESGTLGTKGNTQIVIPHITENYGATRDPPEKSIPVCTLKNFPNQIQHTLQWARDYFEGVFRQSAEDVNSYLSSTEEEFKEILSKQQNTKLDTVKSIHRTLVEERPLSFEDCIIWARLKFEDLFHNQIRQLLHNFPEDQVTSTGTKFWSGSKRCPKPLSFDIDAMCEDAEMRNHYDFIVAAANLRAKMYGIKGTEDGEVFKSVLANVMIPDFVPKEGVKIAANDAEAKENEESGGGDSFMEVDDECDNLLAQVRKPSELAGFRLEPIEFDKDVDEHMLFVTACSNLRALNYGIPTEDTHKSRAIAGKIIPAIATTTALVTGLICLELYKTHGTARRELKIDAYKNGFVNLAIPFMTLSEPTPPSKTKAVLKGKEWNWTAWDSIDINKGDITMKEFMDLFKEEYNAEVTMLSQGVSILYSFFANKKKVQERMVMPMSEVVKSVTKKDLPENQVFLILEVIASDLDTDEDLELPYVKFRFR